MRHVFEQEVGFTPRERPIGDEITGSWSNSYTGGTDTN